MATHSNLRSPRKSMKVQVRARELAFNKLSACCRRSDCGRCKTGDSGPTGVESLRTEVMTEALRCDIVVALSVWNGLATSSLSCPFPGRHRESAAFTERRESRQIPSRFIRLRSVLG